MDARRLRPTPDRGRSGQCDCLPQQTGGSPSGPAPGVHDGGSMIAIAQRIFLCLMLSGIAAAQVSSDDLKSGPNQNWLTYIGDYFAQRFSPLTAINRSNVARLAPKWVRHIDG